VGFVNAGLITFLQSISVMLGANVGTTLAMQVVSFDAGKYAYLAIGLGFAIDLFSRRPLVKNLGVMLLAFGLLFLGIEIMKEAVLPFRESPLVAGIFGSVNAGTFAGMAGGIVVSALLTALMQSSGATIGILFALCGAGVIADFGTLFPLILGAHIGTCVVTLFAAVGTNIAARRTALSHLAFNVLGAVLAVCMFPVYKTVVPVLSGPDLARQAANAHTLIQAFNAGLFLLAAVPFAGLVRILLPSKEKEEVSFLNHALLDMPEDAIMAALREVARMLVTTRRMLERMGESFRTNNTALFGKVEQDENVVDRLKYAVMDYLIGLGQRRVSSRQALMIQYVNHAAADIERVADHIESLVEVAGQMRRKAVWFDTKDRREITGLFTEIDALLDHSIRSLDPADPKFKRAKTKIGRGIDRYHALAGRIRRNFVTRIRTHKKDALTGYFFSRYMLSLDKVIKHVRSIFQIENERFFFIKDYKIGRRSPSAQARNG
jgi:phosphate:Na+ symporter